MNLLYLIGFIGTDNFYKVRANRVKDAKTLFAQYHNIPLSSKIVAKKWTVEMMNKYCNHSDKLTIDPYRAEIGYPSAEGIPS